LQVLLDEWQGVLVVVKVLRKGIVERASAAELHQFKQEAAMLRGLRHPYILSFYRARLNSHDTCSSARCTGRRAGKQHALLSCTLC